VGWSIDFRTKPGSSSLPSRWPPRAVVWWPAASGLAPGRCGPWRVTTWGAGRPNPRDRMCV